MTRLSEDLAARAASTSTCGSSPSWDFTDVRRAALALAREVERRVPKLRDQQVVEGGAPRRLRRLQPERPRPHRRLGLLGPPDARRPRLGPARVGRGAGRRPGRASRSTPSRRGSRSGDPRAEIDEHAGSLDALLDLAARDEAEGLGDAPWPPHFRKQKGEPKRVQPPSRAQEGGLGLDARAGRRCTSCGSLSSRQRRIFEPWRMRPSETWSKVISTTSSGRSESHSSSRSVAQRLGSAEPARRSRRARAWRPARASPWP